MAIKKVLLQKKLDNVLYDIFPQTTADAVKYGESTVKEALDSLNTGIGDVYTKTEADKAIKDADDALYNKILGKVDDTTTIDQAYDTLKEIADWIKSDEDGAAAMANSISNLKSTVGDDDGGLVKDVNGLKTTVGDSTGGLVKDVNDLKAVGSTKVEASTTNGNIKIDGEETTVYTHPETHDADFITETETRVFVTPAQKTIIDTAAAIRFVDSSNEVDNERDLFCVALADVAS